MIENAESVPLTERKGWLNSAAERLSTSFCPNPGNHTDPT
jgi:hypothetical protein